MDAGPVHWCVRAGHNGRDGYQKEFGVPRALLDEAGWPVRVALLGAREKLKASRWAASTVAGCWNPSSPKR